MQRMSFAHKRFSFELGLASFALICLSACITGVDEIGFSESEPPSYSIPLLSTSFSLGEALGDYDFVGTLQDQNGYRLIRRDTVIRRYPITSIRLPQFPIPLIDTFFEISLADLGQKVPVSRVEFASGNLEYTLTSQTAEPITIALELTNFERQGQSIVIRESLAAREQISSTLDLAGGAFTIGSDELIRIRYDARKANGERVKLNGFGSSVRLANYVAQSATGTLDSVVVPLGVSKLRTDYFRDLAANTASVRDATVRYTILSTLPTEIALVASRSFAALRDGSIFNFRTPIDDGIFVPADTPGPDSAKLVFEINALNSELLDAVRLFPDSIIFDLNGIANPFGDKQEVTITADDFVLGYYTFDVPLDVSFNSFLVNQEFSFGGTDELENISGASLVVSSVNAIPVGAAAQIYLLNDNGLVTDSLFAMRQNLVQAANVQPGSGEVSRAARDRVELAIPDRLLPILLAGTRARLQLALRTPSPDNNFVKLRSDQRLNLDIGLNFTTRR